MGMADDKKNTAESPQSRMKAIDPKLITKLQSQTRLLDQLQSHKIVFGRIPSRIMAAAPKKSPSSDPMLQPIREFVKNNNDLFDLANEKAFEHSARKNLIYQLTEFRGLAKKTRNPELGQKVTGLIYRTPALGKQELKDEILRIEESVTKTGNPILSKGFKNVKVMYDEFGGQLIKEVNKTNKIKQILKLKNADKWLRIGKKASGGVSVFFDVYDLVGFFNKLGQKKAKSGDWVDAVISGVSLVGNVLGLISLFAAGTAISASLAPVAAVIGGVALTAGLAKLAYDNLLSDEALKKAPKKPNIRNPLGTSGLFEIPTNARGTSYFRGGLSLVGEEGPELVNLPRGSQVFSHSRTKSLLNGMGSGSAGISVNYSPQIIIQGNADARVMKTASDNSYADFERKFNALMDRRRRLSFAGG